MKYVIGIDEVGRGALAGPITVAAAFLPDNLLLKIKKSGFKMRDSKKLSPKQRQEWFQYIKNRLRLAYGLAFVSPKVIDRINISQAANLAAGRALQKLKTSQVVNFNKVDILLDGGLYININKKNLNSKTIIKGDEKIPAIMLASIIAKVSRDRLMVKINKKYSLYGFDRHKGYGTQRHIKAIQRYGPSKLHRLTFIKKYYKIKS